MVKKIKLQYIGNSKELLDSAFRRARKEALQVKHKNRLYEVKLKALKKIDVSSDYIIEKLDAIVKKTPNLDELEPFYKEIVDEVIDVNAFRKALGHIHKVVKLIRRVRKETAIKIKKIRDNEDREKIYVLQNGFYGRLSSLVESLDKSLEVINDSRRKLYEMPHVKTNLSTAILAGFPNTGKTTLLKELTGSKAEINSYPFTTKSLKIGYFTVRYKEIQVIDTPGLLDRPLEKRNKVERKAITAIKHLGNLIVFVIDPTERCGYSLEKQVDLLKGIKKEFNLPVIIALNKSDLAKEKDNKKAKELIKKSRVKAVAVLETGHGIETDLKNEIVKELKAIK